MFWILEDKEGFVEGIGPEPTGAKVYECEEAWAKAIEKLQEQANEK